MKLIFSMVIALAITINFGSCHKTIAEEKPVLDTVSLNPPVLKGKLVFHTYSCYSCNDSKLYLYDFSSGKFSRLGQSWDIVNPMNAHFSPDGKRIVFMGISMANHSWDIFMYDLESTALPRNLTSNSAGRDEDPKFSPDGNKIVYKSDGIITVMDTSGTGIKSFKKINGEASMPYFSADGNNLLFAAKEAESDRLDIDLLNLSDETVSILSNNKNVEEYYPISRNDTSFLFTRWIDPSNSNDQVYLGFYDHKPSMRLLFNTIDANYSDAYPVNDQFVVLSSTKYGGRGGYDLYIANVMSGKIWSLNFYNSYLNTSDNELGSCYSSQ